MMSAPRHIAARAEQADQLLDALEKAAACGFANDVMKQVADAGGLGTPEIYSAARKRWREYAGRGKDCGPVSPAQVTVLWEGCAVLGREMCARSKRQVLADIGLATEAIFAAVVVYQAACSDAPIRKRSRGKPSHLKTPEAARFIRQLADIWGALTDRQGRPGDGDTTTLNLNRFIHRTFTLAGVKVSAYSLPRITTEVLAN